MGVPPIAALLPAEFPGTSTVPAFQTNHSGILLLVYMLFCLGVHHASGLPHKSSHPCYHPHICHLFSHERTNPWFLVPVQVFFSLSCLVLVDHVGDHGASTNPLCTTVVWGTMLHMGSDVSVRAPRLAIIPRCHSQPPFTSGTLHHSDYHNLYSLQSFPCVIVGVRCCAPSFHSPSRFQPVSRRNTSGPRTAISCQLVSLNATLSSHPCG